MRNFSRVLFFLFMIILLGFSSLALWAKTPTADSNYITKKHLHHKKKKGTNVNAIPLEPQTEVTDQREVSEQPGKTR